MKECRLQTVGLLGFLIGMPQALASLLQGCRHLFQFVHMGRQRLLHLLEMLLQTAYLVVVIILRYRLIIIALGNPTGRIGEEDEILQLMMEQCATKDEEQQQPYNGDAEDPINQAVIVAENVILRIYDTHTPYEGRHRTTWHC